MEPTLTFDPLVFAALCFAALLALGAPVAAALVVRRLTGAPWVAMAFGVLTFIVSQPVLRLPWQIWVGVHYKDAFKESPALMLAWIVFSSFTAGLFEETGRYAAFRKFLTKERSFRVGLMFGVGHGGIESILLVGITLAANTVIYLLVAKGVPLPFPKEAHDAIVKQFAAATPGLAMLGGIERLSSMCVHCAASLMVLRAVTSKQLRWYALALGFHFTSNLVGVEAAQKVGPYAGEVVIAAFAAAGVAFIVGEWRRERSSITP